MQYGYLNFSFVNSIGISSVIDSFVGKKYQYWSQIKAGQGNLESVRIGVQLGYK